MPPRQAEAPCAACQRVAPSSRLCRVVVDGRSVLLCREHAAVVARAMPKTFSDLRALFPEPITGDAPARRSAIDRRAAEDRRGFPPRPEGRRQGGGRRDGDRAA